MTLNKFCVLNKKLPEIVLNLLTGADSLTYKIFCIV